MFVDDYIRHLYDCNYKQSQSISKIAGLPERYTSPLSQADRLILGRPIAKLVQDVQEQSTSPLDVLGAYGKAALKAHAKTNCLTEILFPEAETWFKGVQVNLKGPLAGVPVSLKDSIVVGGFDTTVGYSRNSRLPAAEDGAIVKLLKDAGAVPFVKTNLPVTLLSFESANDVWGRTTNPHNGKFSPGGSTGGEAALLACGGSRIGIGSDVAGSVRVPAHFSGCYSLRCSTGRWPKSGMRTSMAGQEGVPSVFSPMARTLDDLMYFSKAILGMKPWKYDHSVHPIPWRDETMEEWGKKQTLRIGVLRSDGVVDPSPACARALQMTVEAMEAAGHTVTDISPPAAASPASGLILASRLLNADGCKTFRSAFRPGEWSDKGAAQLSFYASLPHPLRYLHYLYVRYVRHDPLWADLLLGFREQTVPQQWILVAQREAYRAEWHQWWNNLDDQEDGGLDVILTPPNATPAVPHDGMRDAVSSCGYTFLFNLLDYTAGVLPVTHVDAAKDALPANFDLRSLNGVARGAMGLYDARAMDGLPVGVQVVGRRLEEEKVLAVMGGVERALEDVGEEYQLLDVD